MSGIEARGVVRHDRVFANDKTPTKPLPVATEKLAVAEKHMKRNAFLETKVTVKNVSSMAGLDQK